MTQATSSTKPQKHSQRSHALLSASGAGRWLNCTPSAKLEDEYGEKKSSAYAEEGTLAHELSELYLRKDTLNSVLVTDLFSANTWKGSSEDGCLTMLKGEYKVKLNYKGVYVSIYKNNELIHQKLSNVPDMTVNEFINYLDNFIKNHENGNH